MQNKQLSVLASTTESREKFWHQKNAYKPTDGLECCLFEGCGSVVVAILFNVLPIVCGNFVFVSVLLCITLCPL